MLVALPGCDKATARQETKELLIDILRALPGGLKEAGEKVFEPAVDAVKEDAKDIYNQVRPNWEEAFPSLAEKEGEETPPESGD